MSKNMQKKGLDNLNKTTDKITPLAQDDFMISLTAAARDYLSKFIASRERTGVRFWVKKAGCSGLMYKSELCDAAEKGDYSFELGSSEVISGKEFKFSIFVDRAAKKALNGVVIDYIKGELGQAKLTYVNPNETAKCGCGESFMMDDSKN